MINTLLLTIYNYVIEHGPTFMIRLFIAFFVCLGAYIIIKFIVFKVESNIENTSLVIDAYTIKTATLV